MQRFKRFALITGITLITLLLLLLIASYFLGDKVKAMVVAEVNEQVKTEISVDDIYFSVFENFPQASVSFVHVKINESAEIYAAPLAELDKVSITLNLLDVLNKEAKLQKLILDQGYVQLALDNKGHSNFDILKSDSSSTDTSSNRFDLKNVILQNVTVSYEDKSTQFYSASAVEELRLKGSFSDSQFELELNGELKQTLDIAKTTWLSQQQVSLNTALLIDNEKSEIHFNETNLKLEQIGLNIKGKWSTASEGGKLDIEASDLKIKQLLSLLPGKVKNNIDAYQSAGTIRFRLKLEETAKTPLRIKSDFTIDQGSLYLEEFGEGLSQIKLKGKLDYSKKAQSLVLESFESRLMNDLIKGTLKLNNFENPYLDVFCLASIDLSNLKRISKADFLQNSSGKIDLDVSAKGKLSDLKDPKRFKQVFLDGKLKGQQIKIADDSLGFSLDQTDFFVELKEERTHIHQLSTTFDGNRYEVKAEAQNLLSYLFEDGTLDLNGSIKSDKVSFSGPKNETQNNPKDTSRFSFPERIRLNVACELGEFTLDKFTAKSLKGLVYMHPRGLEIRGMELQNAQGSMKLNGAWTIKADGGHQMVGHANLKDVDITDLFEEFNDFGQSNITKKHLSGKLSGETDFGFLYDAQFNFLPKSLYAWIKVKIDQGRLVNYEPLLALSKFVSVDDLKDVKFESLSNELEIRDEKILIPQMNIRNSALNLSLEGEQHFSGIMNYSIELQLKDLLASSYAKKHEPDEFEKEETGVKVFIRMSGSPDKLDIRYDRKNARKNFREEMKKEKQTVKELLRKEFGLDSKTETNEQNKTNSDNWEDDIPE
ncbi:MAG: hypothetical protein EP332_05500 [Bacteroidetes bacterium]|nr:MAG: hypothetical protein EP332_05500 [Bacteroidota bacterium]